MAVLLVFKRKSILNKRVNLAKKKKKQNSNQNIGSEWNWFLFAAYDKIWIETDMLKQNEQITTIQFSSKV